MACYKMCPLCALTARVQQKLNHYPACSHVKYYLVLLIFYGICRRRLEYGLVTNPNSEVDDQELISAIRLIREDAPFSGTSMVIGSLRANGILVTRERVRQTLRNLDPLGTALRWPAGATKRHPYCSRPKFFVAHWYVEVVLN